MKRIYLVFAYLFPFTWNIVAQVNLPPSFLANQSNLSPTVKKSLSTYLKEKDQSGYQIQTKIVADDLQLDSTISYHQTDAGGGNFIVTPFERTDYFYINPKTIIERESILEDGRWKKSFQSTFRFDDQERLFAILSESFDPDFGFLIPETRFRIFFHGNSQTLGDSIFLETWSADSLRWVRSVTIYNSFNEMDLIFESVTILTNDGGEQSTLKDKYYYDDRAKNVLIESFTVEGESEISTGKEENQYILDYLISTETSIADGAGGFFPLTRTDYSYNTHGDPDTIQAFQYLALNATWTLTDAHYQNYDNDNRLSREVLVKFVLEAPVEHQIIAYDYLQDQFLIWKSVFFRHLTTGLEYLEYKTQYYYSTLTTSNKPVPSQFQILTLSPNPTQNQVEFRARQGSTIRLYDLNGQLIQTQSGWEGVNSMDLSLLAPGHYTIILKDKNGLFTGKIIKQ